jgi:hypothetical protein
MFLGDLVMSGDAAEEEQSVLRIYARGYRAADLRRLVQDANLARGCCRSGYDIFIRLLQEQSAMVHF